MIFTNNDLNTDPTNGSSFIDSFLSSQAAFRSKCSHDFSGQRCSQCGISFTQYLSSESNSELLPA